MTLALGVLAALVVVAAQVALNLRWFRRAPAPGPGGFPVSILIPARNEEAHIEAAVRAACAQTCPVEVVVLDDQSTDDTPRILARLEGELPRLRVVRGAPLPDGWAGKAWACWQLASEHARHGWLLFIDADVRLAPDAGARAQAAATAESAAFASAFPRQLTGSAGEALIVPLIHLVLLAYLPLPLVRLLGAPSFSAGCGQFMLVRREAYRAAGGHRAVRATLHDGILLARLMKRAGFRIAVLDGSDLARCRMYVGFGATWRGFSRNAYEAFGSPVALAVMVALNAGLFILPFAALPLAWLGGSVTTAAWAAAAGLALAIRAAVAARFGHPVWTVLATPVAVALMLGIQLHSAFNHLAGRRVLWRARAYTPHASPAAPGKD
jgi:glycosyltransferase involved in cell wall biosynthesis